ncbi:MAG: carboxy-S-adenosyl-L-methionine synthase CmoA [Cellvibrionales bacterium]|nr:carboxy-S-adenosyl-L-methionine synthase CmoA [Cellvibrionales bacterium]
MNAPRDTLYAAPRDQIAEFEFDHRVAAVFPDMIRRSVPGYDTVLAMTALLAARHAQPGSRCYDLGCSLGASTRAIHQALPAACRGKTGCQIIAVDSSPAMVEQCKKEFADPLKTGQIAIHQADMRDIEITDASLVILNFSLQFLPTADRRHLIERIHASMRPGGALLVSEKVRIADPHLDQLFRDAHAEFKLRQGYSRLEIAQKRAALENVLISETIDQHFARFQAAGFTRHSRWFQCLNFCSMLALR